MLIFPIVMLFIFITISAISLYIDKPLNKLVKLLFLILVLTDLTLSLTNSVHLLVLNVPLDNLVTFSTFQSASFGPILFIHTGISYMALLWGFILIVTTFYKRLKDTDDIIPFIFIVFSLISAFLLNIVHLFVYTFHFDPTFISIVLFISVLYYIFYIRDINLFMSVGRNRFLLDNLSEKYIIVDDTGLVIESSNQLSTELNISSSEYSTFESLKKLLANQAILYYETDEVQYSNDENKKYLQVKEKKINLPLFKKTGTLYSFIDNTADIKYINDVNYMKRHDLMTKLYNRNYLEDIRDDVDDSNEHYHIIMFDVDGLKLFNDYLGHEAGDDLLIRFSNQLISVTKEEKIYPIRLGGDEYIILAINKSEERINAIIRNLEALNNSLSDLMKVHYSYAISSNMNNGYKMNQVLSEADMNMYKMKQNKDDYKTKLRELLEKEKNRIKKS